MRQIEIDGQLEKKIVGQIEIDGHLEKTIMGQIWRDHKGTMLAWRTVVGFQ